MIRAAGDTVILRCGVGDILIYLLTYYYTYYHIEHYSKTTHRRTVNFVPISDVDAAWFAVLETNKPHRDVDLIIGQLHS